MTSRQDALNVLVTKPFSDAQLAVIAAASEQVRVSRALPAEADYAEADVVYGDTLPSLDKAPSLKWFQLHGAGINHLLEHPVYQREDIAITTASGVHAASVAEYAVTMMLALAHRVGRMLAWQAKGSWPPDGQRWPLFVPVEVRGASIGIIGYGSIGREVARLARTAFGMRVLACKRDVSSRADTGYSLPGTGDPEGVLPDEWYSIDQVGELLERSDVVVMAAPLTHETRGMLGRAELALMKPSAFFINVGRGATVDEAALAEALAQERIAGAGLDVFEQEPLPPSSPLYRLDNVILSPHVSGFIPSYDDRCCELFALNLRRFLAGQPLLNLVDRSLGY